LQPLLPGGITALVRDYPGKDGDTADLAEVKTIGAVKVTLPITGSDLIRNSHPAADGPRWRPEPRAMPSMRQASAQPQIRAPRRVNEAVPEVQARAQRAGSVCGYSTSTTLDLWQLHRQLQVIPLVAGAWGEPNGALATPRALQGPRQLRRPHQPARSGASLGKPAARPARHGFTAKAMRPEKQHVPSRVRNSKQQPSNKQPRSRSYDYITIIFAPREAVAAGLAQEEAGSFTLPC